MRAEIISIGNELLSGKTVNTNASYIAERLYEIGILTHRVVTVGDDAGAIRESLDQALQRSDVVLVTGGLGPTHDDITKKVISHYFGSQLVLDESILADVRKRFECRGIPMPEINRTQAMIPEGVPLMDNPIGTARGMIFSRGEKLVFVMPGVPKEMAVMMENSVLPILKEKCPQCHIQVDLSRYSRDTKRGRYLG